MTAIIVTGPAGCGKTRNAETLRRMFGCVGVCDGWSHGQPIRSGYLHLTNEERYVIRNVLRGDDVRVVDWSSLLPLPVIEERA